MNRLLCKKKNELTNKKKKAFTLVELIIVIAIIAILAAIAIPKFGEIRESASAKDDMATAKNIATVIAQQMADGAITADVGTAKDVEASILSKLDGNTKPKANGHTSDTFQYTIIDGNIKVLYSGGGQLYPIS